MAVHGGCSFVVAWKQQTPEVRVFDRHFDTFFQRLEAEVLRPLIELKRVSLRRSVCVVSHWRRQDNPQEFYQAMKYIYDWSTPANMTLAHLLYIHR